MFPLVVLVPVVFLPVPPVSSSSVWLKLVPSICVGIVSFVVTMDPSHGREIHYHLTRAIMDLNTIAGFLPFFEPTVDWHEHPHDPYGRPLRVHPSHRPLHAFAPHPASSSTPTLASHGGLPTHMILNPAPHLHPLSIRRVPGPIEDHPPASHPTAVESTSSTRARPSGPSVHTIAVTSSHTVSPIARDSLSEDARPKQKQRAMTTATSSI